MMMVMPIIPPTLRPLVDDHRPAYELSTPGPEAVPLSSGNY
jgi:hypothetical protein